MRRRPLAVGGLERVEALIDDLPEVTDLVYIDQEQAFADAQELFADEPSMVEILRLEDVPSSFSFIVPDTGATVDAQQALQGDEAVLDVSVPLYDGRTVEELLGYVGEEEIEGSIGKAGHWIDPDVAARVLGDAPDEIADDLALVLDALASDDGVLGEEHGPAARSVLSDARQRCEDDG